MEHFFHHTLNTLSLIDLENNNNHNNINQVFSETTNNINFYENHRKRQPVNSTELIQNSDPLNTTLPVLPILNKPLPRLQRQNSVHFNTEPVILNTSTQPAPSNNQNIQLAPQQLVNSVRQFNSQTTQQMP